ncbi:MAG: hypothetical protein M1812_001726 [Candelaria pacifica]|nr:MAG: hypothetical protein M1812_001726 [Candelaria pacifica]
MVAPEAASNRMAAVSHGNESSEREGSQESQDPASSKIAHTLTACCRCRQAKTRCDVGLPRCSRCDRSGALCEYFDTTKGKKIPRTYVIHLQDRVQALEEELARITEDESLGPDAESMVREAGLVRFTGSDESRFLGPSSGIAITRLVMELAKQNTETKSIKEIVPDQKAQQIKDRFALEDSPTSKVYPLVSDVAAPTLPSRVVADKLTEAFNQRAQFLLPTLHEPTFRQDLEDVYNGSQNAYQNFALRMVLAISMQKLDTQYAGLADSYYLAALAYLETAVRPMDLKTLQCFALIAQYSMLTPTRTAAYYIVGLAVRLCQHLGLHEEKTIVKSSTKYPLDPLQLDMRRRLFWIVTSMEFGLSHSLGRPSAFASSQDHIDVTFFKAVDDAYITAGGILRGPPSPKKQIAIHFFKMRLLQAEIRRKLYQKKRDEPDSDSHPWFAVMVAKLDHWRFSSPNNDEGTGLSAIWFTVRYNTMVVFLFRPSPQIPRPSMRAATLCFNAAIFNVREQRRQIDTHLIDITWIFTQAIFMALNTILWSISYPHIRRLHTRSEVEGHVEVALEAILLCSERWPGATSAFELYEKLAKACLKVYDESNGNPEITHSASDQTSPSSLRDFSSPSPPVPSNSSETTISRTPSFQKLAEPPTSTGHNFDAYHTSPHSKHLSPNQQPQQQFSPSARFQDHYQPQLQSQYSDFTNPSFHVPMQQPLPSSFPDPFSWDPIYPNSGGAQNAPLSSPSMLADPNLFAGPLGSQYTDHLYAPYPMMQHPQQQQGQGSLNQEQQLELMNNLETTGLQDIGNIIEQSAIFFSTNKIP